MDKKLMICGIVLLILAALCFGLSFWFRFMHRTVLDGSSDLYSRLYRRQLVCLFLGIGFAISGALMILVRFIKKG